MVPSEEFFLRSLFRVDRNLITIRRIHTIVAVLYFITLIKMFVVDDTYLDVVNLLVIIEVISFFYTLARLRSERRYILKRLSEFGD